MESFNWIDYERKVRSFVEEKNNEPSKELFLRDGIVNEKEWNKKGNIKTLFIFKEFYGRTLINDYSSFDSYSWRDIINENDMNDIFVYPEWKKIATLAKGIEKAIVTGKYLSDDDYCPEKCDHKKEINKIAIINLKKLAGGTSAGSKRSLESLSYVEHCRKFSKEIREQIEYINPNFIVCCHEDVLKCLKTYLYPEYKRKQGNFVIDNRITAVSCCLPSYESKYKEKFKDFFFSWPANEALALMAYYNEPLTDYYEKLYDRMIADGVDYKDFDSYEMR